MKSNDNTEQSNSTSDNLIVQTDSMPSRHATSTPMFELLRCNRVETTSF